MVVGIISTDVVGSHILTDVVVGIIPTDVVGGHILTLTDAFCSRETTLIESNGEQLFLHITPHLDMIYTPTKYYQNISKGTKVMD